MTGSPEIIRPCAEDQPRIEREANDFACQILMPEVTFRARHAELKGHVAALADTFAVPVEAVERRIRMLGLGAPADETA